MTIEILQQLQQDAKEIERMKNLLASLASPGLSIVLHAQKGQFNDAFYHSITEQDKALKEFWIEAFKVFKRSVENRLEEQELKFSLWEKHNSNNGE